MVVTNKSKNTGKYIEKYYVVTNSNLYQLTRSVRKRIENGGKVVGGVVVDNSLPKGDKGKYIQTIIFD